MAVYKPSNCRPFLNAVDLTKTQSLQCEINTSNTNITGYKLRILDNLNNVIFEGKDYDTKIYYLNGRGQIESKLIAYPNGSIFTVDFLIVDYTSSFSKWGLVGYNTIYCHIVKKEGKDMPTYYKRLSFDGNIPQTGTSGNAEVIKNFSNDYFNQPYKYEITVAQGQKIEKNGEVKVEDYSYDVLVSNGQILGSTTSRIQSYLSDEIYKDYYIQLLNDEEKQEGNRARIASYDRTFGYIYPQEGSIKQEDFKAATKFCIYKDTNDPEAVDGDRLVNWALAVKAENGNWWKAFKIDQKPDNFSVSELKNFGNKYYYDMVVTGVTEQQYKDFNSNSPSIPEIFGQGVGNIIYSSTRFLFMAEGKDKFEDNNYNSTTSPMNGVWVLVGATDFNEDEGSCHIRWERPAGANAWANYLGRSWFVNNGVIGAQDGKLIASVNITSNADSGTSGKINESSIAFFPEKEVEIYPGNKDEKGKSVASKTRGSIFKTDVNRIYLRPFVGLEDGMRLRWVDAEGKTQYFDISELNKDYYYCTPVLGSITSLEDSNVLNPDTKYKVYTYFKISDENPFYGYSTPELKIDFKPELADATTYPFIGQLNSRSLDVMGEYIQAQHIAWKYYKWVLTDISVNSTVDTGEIYNGIIEYHFDGLQDNHRYQITLIVEDEVGYVKQSTVDFKVSLADLGSGETFPLEISFDCVTQSIDINFTRHGLIIPYYWDETQEDYGATAEGYKYKERSVQIPNNKTLYYDKVKAFNTEKEEAPIYASLSGPEGNDITFNTEHTAISRYFTGELFETEIILDSAEQDLKVKIGGLMPVTTTINEYGDVIPNPDRNKIFLNYWTESSFKNLVTNTIYWEYNNGSLESQFFTFSGLSNKTELIAYYGEDKYIYYWRKPNPIVYAYQNPKEVKANRLGNYYDYLPISYFDELDREQYRKKQLSRTENPEIPETIEDGQGLIVEGIEEGEDYRFYYFTPEEYNCSQVLHFPLEHHTEYYTTIDMDNSTAHEYYEVKVQEGDTQERDKMLVREIGKDIEDLTVWQDAKGFLATQINGLHCNVKAKKVLERDTEGKVKKLSTFMLNKWVDNDGILNIWTDKCASGVPCWKGIDVNTYERQDENGQKYIDNKDGRQYITNLGTLTFNVAVKNFDINEVNFRNVLELSGLCFVTGGINNG